ncbi:hypothetical protein [Gottfriedia acidiceleris]|uniref:hypothetical protein n=1 Tax=Gottfriedia acidiceleris TaxID=371036 RepID=UPI0030006CF4
MKFNKKVVTPIEVNAKLSQMKENDILVQSYYMKECPNCKMHTPASHFRYIKQSLNKVCLGCAKELDPIKKGGK